MTPFLETNEPSLNKDSMAKKTITDDDEGKLVLKSIKLTQPLVKPEIKEAVLPVERHISEPVKETIITRLIHQLKKIKDELFK